ncbi:MAG: nuclease-related domain-containing protein [Desulfurivibrionaceae bacterium]|nr:nuclease-related domain-containing protein [Desulfurivibrionaceae bacterium]
MQFLVPLAPSLILLILCLAPTSAIAFIFRRATRNKKPSLTTDFPRGPGQTRQTEIEEVTADILTKTVIIPFIPLIIYSILVAQCTLSPARPGNAVISLYLIGTVAIIFSLCRDVWTLINRSNSLRLQVEGERAVGQELSILTAAGFRIFHDFPAPDFKIDHLAVGPQGIFVIETTPTAKTKKEGQQKSTVQFDDEKLIPPGWGEKQPVQEAKDKSVWLEKWLEKSTGELHKTTAVIAVLGWAPDRAGSGRVKIYNGKDPAFLADGPIILNKSQIESVSLLVANKYHPQLP